MKRYTLRLIDGYVSSFHLLVVVSQVLLVTTNGDSPWIALASSVTHRILESLGTKIVWNTVYTGEKRLGHRELELLAYASISVDTLSLAEPTPSSAIL